MKSADKRGEDGGKREVAGEAGRQKSNDEKLFRVLVREKRLSATSKDMRRHTSTL